MEQNRLTWLSSFFLASPSSSNCSRIVSISLSTWRSRLLNASFCLVSSSSCACASLSCVSIVVADLMAADALSSASSSCNVMLSDSAESFAARSASSLRARSTCNHTVLVSEATTNQSHTRALQGLVAHPRYCQKIHNPTILHDTTSHILLEANVCDTKPNAVNFTNNFFTTLFR